VKARYRPSTRRLLALVGVTAATAGSLVIGLPAAPAGADITRCVGAVQTPGAFACYTSPRFTSSGLDKQHVADFPVVCYGLGCTASEFHVFVPGDTVDGRFTAVYYLGHTYTIYHPAESQPYVLTSDNPRLDDATQLQVLVLSMALDTANGA